MSHPPLNKRLGQHHLVDGALCRPLLEFLRPRGEAVVEIGPGGGVLTGELLTAGAAAVLAWELDPTWAAELRRRFAGRRLGLVVGDALELPWHRLGAPGPRLVCGNLPYNVATPIIEQLLTRASAGRVARAAFLVQREVAERLAAGPGDPAYGWLSVLVAAYAGARLLGRVRPGSFRPPPRVDSAFVGLTPRPPPLPPAEMPGLLAIVSRAFAQRRKTLRNALGAGWGKPRAAAVLEAAGVAPGARAEELGLTDFLSVYRADEAVAPP